MHCRKASDVFVAIGGFKNLYPLVGKVVKSNLLELGRGKPGHIFSLFFKILGSFLNQEPEHMMNLMDNRNLIGLLRYCMLKIGKYQMVTQELLSDVKNIIKQSTLSQVTFVNDQKLGYNDLAMIQSKKIEEFYRVFIRDFMH